MGNPEGAVGEPTPRVHLEAKMSDDARLSAIEARLSAIESRLSSGAQQTTPSDSKAIADDGDLDGEWGDPVVRFGLKAKWWPEQPDPNIGYKFSECPPEYLDATAKYLGACAYMKRKEGDEKKAGYKDRDAARARGWAKRIRAGFKAPARAEADDDAASQEIPF